MSTIRINKTDINNYKTSFDNAKTSFNSESYNSFKNSYLATCSDSTVQAMYSNLNSLYSKINNGYESVDEYWSGFNEDSSSLESSLETDSNTCSNVNVSSYLSTFLGVLDEPKNSITDSLEITKDKIVAVAEAKKTDDENSDDEYDYKDFYFINDPIMRKLIQYFSYTNAKMDYIKMCESGYYIENFDYYSLTPKEKQILSLVAPDMNESNFSDYTEYIIYLKQVENMYGDDVPIAAAVVRIDELEEIDKENGYLLLHSTPFLINGRTNFLNGSHINENLKYGNDMVDFEYNGEYLLYYNEDGVRVIAPVASFSYDEDGSVIETVYPEETRKKIIKNNTKYYNSMMHEVSKYPEEYRKTVFKKGDQITLLNGCYKEGTQATTYYSSNGRSNVILRTDLFMNEENDFEIDDYQYRYAVGTFNHEVGHKYDNAMGRITDSEEWEELYKQISEVDSNNSKTSDYAKYSKAELLAECMEEYYNFDGTSLSDDSPNDLKELEIDITVDGVHYDNMYDYIEKVVLKM